MSFPIAALCLGCVLAHQDPTVQTPGPVDQKHVADIQRDADLGKKYSEQVEKENKLSTNEAALARLQRIGKEFAEIANKEAVVVTWGDRRLNPFNYTFKLLKGDEVNAFSLPGGYIYFYEGLLDFADSDDELAGVVAHEVAHASLRHVATLQREQSRLSTLTIPLILAGIFAGGEAGANLGTLGTLVGQAKASGWSIQAEQAADYAGFQYMLKSSYNPVGMLTFMERLNRRDPALESLDWGIYRTHPPSRERAASLRGAIDRYGIPLRRSLVSSHYRASVKEKDGVHEVMYERIRIARFQGPTAEARAVAMVDRLNRFFDGMPALFEVSQSGSEVIGRRSVLYRVTEEDAAAANTTPEALARQTAEGVRRAVAALMIKVIDLR